MNRFRRQTLLGLGLLLCVLPWPVQAQLPLFEDETVVSGLTLPTAFTFLPDGRILIAEKSGVVRLVANGALQPTPFIDLQARVNDYWDRGLLAIAVDPSFATNGYVYLYYVYEHDPANYTAPKTARLTRVTAVGNAASPSTETVLIGALSGASCGGYPAGSDCIPADAPMHNGGAVRAASDGTLFLSIGDGADANFVDDLALRAQNLDSLAGKLLRVTTSGQGVSDNPFWDGNPAHARSKVWAYGLRNPFRFSLRPGTDQPYVGDVGWARLEEISVAKRGVNLGWPCYEGPEQQSGYSGFAVCQSLYAAGPAAVEMPLVSWPHNGFTAAATGGPFYSGTSFPAEYQSAYFYGDYALGFLRYFYVDVNDTLTAGPFEFASGLQGPVDIEMGPDDNLYYLAIYTNELHRIRYTGSTGNQYLQYLSDLPWTSMTSGYGPAERDQSNGDLAANDGLPLTLNGVTYAKGLGAHAPSDIRYAIPPGCTQFVTHIGVDDEVGSAGSVVFQVWADGVQLFTSQTLRGSDAGVSVTVPLSGQSQLQLVVTTAGDNFYGDHADWAGAVFVCAGASSPPVVSAISATGITGTNATINWATDVAADSQVEYGTTTAYGTLTPLQTALTTVHQVPLTGLTPATGYHYRVLSRNAGGALTVSGDNTFTTMSGGGSTTQYLSDLPWTSMTSGYGPAERDQSNGDLAANDGLPLTLNGVTYAKGLGAHAPSDIRYAIPPGCTQFVTHIGVDDEVGSAGSVVFQVWADGVQLFTSQTLRGSDAGVSVTVPLSGQSQLQLVVTTAGDNFYGDHADWAGAVFVCAGASSPPVVSAISATGITGTNATINWATDVAADSQVEYGTTTAYGTLTPLQTALTTVHQVPLTGLTPATGYHYRVLSRNAGGALTVSGDNTFTTMSGGGSTTQYLSDLPWTSMTSGYGPAERDQSNGDLAANDGLPLTLNGVTYAKGLGAHAPSDIRYAIPPGCTQFVTHIGVDDEVGSAGSVVFQVWADGVQLFTSQTLRGSDAGVSVTVPLSGQSQLQLVVTTAGDNFYGDHADWAGAVFVCAPVNTNSAPIPTITSPAPSLAYKVGDVVNYVGSATDAEDGPISGASLSWSIIIHHCPGGTCHNHFFMNTTGASGSFKVPDHGDESHFELVLTATDSVGATASTSVTILPMTVQITLQTSPTGLTVVYGALTGTAPMTRTSIVGSMQTISTLSPQNGLTFSTWSDGGAQQHNILVGQTGAVFTATFATSAPPGTLQLSGATYSVGENGGSATITVRRTGGSAGAVGVSLATSNGTATAGADYTTVTQTVTFANGESGDKPVSVPILEDTAVEGNETVNLTLSNPTGGAALGSPSAAVLTITDNDTAPPGTLQLSGATYSVGENGGSATITVRRTGGSAGAVGVSLATSNGTATAGADYTAVTQTVTFANGESGDKPVSVPILEDTAVEGNETVNLTLSNPTGGAALGSPSAAVLTITDNDTAPPGTLQLSGATYSVGENGGSATITVRRTGGSAGAVGVSLATSNGTATAGADYTTVTQTVTFANGESGDKPVSVPILEDTAVEGNETVNLTLSNPTGGAALGSPSAAVLTITDNDLTLTVMKNGNGTVTSTPTGINCGSDCSEVYTSGAVVTLTATPGRNRVFAGWSGGGCTGTGSCTVTMDANKTVRATFRNQ